MFYTEYSRFYNRICAVATGVLTVSDIEKYVSEIKSLIREKVRDNWTLIVDLRGMEELSAESYKHLNNLRISIIGADHKIYKSAVIVDSLLNQMRSVKSMYELEQQFTEEYFTSIDSAEVFLKE